MDDVVLHPFDSYHWWGKYRAIKREFIDVISNETTMASKEERLASAFGGKINFPDAFIIKRLLERYRPNRILEVGSFLGFSSRWLREVSSAWGGKVTSLDPNIRHRGFDAPALVLRKFNAAFLPDRLDIVEAFFGDPGPCSYEEYERDEPPGRREQVEQIFLQRQRIGKDWDRKFDFIFIDGAHDHSSVLRDFEIALHLLNESGCIAFHDALCWPGVYQALQDIEKEYAASAEVGILGRLDKRILQDCLGKFTSGIGFFRAKSSSLDSLRQTPRVALQAR